jgi:predicted nucleotidyltransferase
VVDRFADPRLQRLFAETDVELAIAFGSAVGDAGRFRPDSDIDIGVLFPKVRTVGLDELGDLAVGLERSFGRDVDLVDLAGASTLLRFEVARGRRLFEHRPGAFADFAARAAMEYDDLRPILLRCGWGLMRKLAQAR